MNVLLQGKRPHMADPDDEEEDDNTPPPDPWKTTKAEGANRRRAAKRGVSKTIAMLFMVQS